MLPSPLRALVLVVFFLSGGAGLVYEVVWTRQLSLIFGATTYAVTTVLATYMGGLAIGSWAMGRVIDRHASPLRTYAWLELGIGLYGLCVGLLFDALRGPYVLLYQLDLPYPMLAAARAGLAALVLLPPTVLMGATFPALVRFVVGLRGDIGRSTGVLYFVNTFGGLAGCLFAGFFLVEHAGLSGSTRLAAAANLSLAAVSAWIATRVGLTGARSSPQTKSDGQGPAVSVLGVRVAVVAAGVSGFTALAYEVIWSRALLRYLYNSTYAFTTMLAAFLAGIAIGSWLYTLIPGRKRHPLLLFAGLELAAGLGFALSAVAFPHLRGLSDALTGGPLVTTFEGSVFTMFVRAAVILLPPAVFLGAAVPAAAEISDVRTPGRSVARIYSANTLGSILGSISVTFVLVPIIGMRGSLALLVALNFVVAVALFSVAPLGARVRRTGLVAAAGLLAVILATLPADVFSGSFAPDGSDLIYYEEGATDTIGVSEQHGHRTIIYDDQRGTASTGSYQGNFFLGHLPVLLHPGEPRVALHICFGVGNSLSALAAHSSIERIDSVELSPHVVGAASYFWTNDNVIQHPKVRTIIDDGRNFVMGSSETYDVIALEPPEPFTAGVINLYTLEFYTDARERLADDGVMLQWVPVGVAPLDEERRLFRSFSDVFPHATAWQQLDQYGPILLIGTKQPLRIDLQRLRSKMAERRVRQNLQLGGIDDPYRLLATFLYDEAGYAEFVEGFAPVLDDHTTLDFSMPRYLGSGFGMGWGTPFVTVDGASAGSLIQQRKDYFQAHKRSVLPLLTDLGDESLEAIASKLAKYQGGFSPPPRLIGRQGWARMRAYREPR